MTDPIRYSTRSNAVRAARTECRKIFGSTFCAFEGPDYEIHPDSRGMGYLGGYQFYFRLRDVALYASETEK